MDIQNRCENSQKISSDRNFQIEIYFNFNLIIIQLKNGIFYQNKDKSDVSINNSSIKSTSFEWKAIVFIVLARDVCFIKENGSLLTLVYVWNLNQSNLSGRRLITSLFSICFKLNDEIVDWNEPNKIASSSGRALKSF